MMESLKIKNNESVDINSIPLYQYPDFYKAVLGLMEDKDSHCVNYYAFRYNNKLKFICCIANDRTGDIELLSHELLPESGGYLDSLSRKVNSLHIYEREISENFGIYFSGHPWAKPVRFPFDRANQKKSLKDYPFLEITGTETHEVGVGPIHAGVIEPGHFRFLCKGETVLHLEIHIGYQHRGIEHLMWKKKHLLQRAVLAESIAGDTVVGHSLAFAGVMETLYGLQQDPKLNLLRALALELERMSIHVGDLSALCVDVAYQLGSSVFGALRTPLINFVQLWCGNRFAKGLIRTGYNPYPFTPELKNKLEKVLEEFEGKYLEMADKTFSLPSLLNRFEKTGILSREQGELIGAVGMAARMTGIKRDIRASHPFGYFKSLSYEPATFEEGDVWARAMLRNVEVKKSLQYIRELLKQIDHLPEENRKHRYDLYKKPLKANQFCISLTEGWRGEICHCAITNSDGELVHYKIKDPSFHNWLALGLVVRDNEISDFPVCNKSFNLSYCGYDL